MSSITWEAIVHRVTEEQLEHVEEDKVKLIDSRSLHTQVYEGRHEE